MSALRNIPQSNRRGTAQYINVYNSKHPEEQIGLYEAPTGASAQYESKKLQTNNSPLYAKVKRDSHKYESLSQSDKSQSHYADVETCSTARPRKMEKVETNYTQVTIFDDHPYDESPSKPS